MPTILLAPLYAVWLPLPGLAFMGIGIASRKAKGRALGTMLLCGMVLAMCAMYAGCGRGNSTPPPPQNYTVTVTATSGGIVHNTHVAVTVQ